jgi:hypothetical protein
MQQMATFKELKAGCIISDPGWSDQEGRRTLSRLSRSGAAVCVRREFSLNKGGEIAIMTAYGPRDNRSTGYV